MWVTEKDYFVQSTDYGHDLNTAIILLAKHEVCCSNLYLWWKGIFVPKGGMEGTRCIVLEDLLQGQAKEYQDQKGGNWIFHVIH